MELFVLWYLRINGPGKSHDFTSMGIIAYYHHDWPKFKVMLNLQIWQQPNMCKQVVFGTRVLK